MFRIFILFLLLGSVCFDFDKNVSYVTFKHSTIEVYSDLKTDVDNLYVCDRSVIPEDWGLPPSLTILALGKRLAQHLAGERAAA
jgi:hypothetical protein